MKRLLLLCAITVAPVLLKAQTNATAPITNSDQAISNAAPTVGQRFSADTNAPSHAPSQTEISSDSGSFDQNTRIAVFVDNVVVKDPQMTLTCGIMTAHLPASEKIDSIVAEKNVVIDGQDNEGKPIHATCDKAVYTYRVLNSVTNETIVLTGNPYPRIERDHSSIVGETITWDRATGHISATKQTMVLVPESNARTNTAHATIKP